MDGLSIRSAATDLHAISPPRTATFIKESEYVSHEYTAKSMRRAEPSVLCCPQTRLWLGSILWSVVRAGSPLSAGRALEVLYGYLGVM